MVVGVGCVPSRQMLNSVDFALTQAKKDSAIHGAIAPSSTTSPTNFKGREKEALLYNRSRNAGRRRNKAPDEADWGVNPKSGRNRSNGRAEAPRSSKKATTPRLFGDKSRSPRNVVKHHKEALSKGSSKQPLTQMTPIQKLRSFERRSNPIATNRTITPKRNRTPKTPQERMSLGNGKSRRPNPEDSSPMNDITKPFFNREKTPKRQNHRDKSTADNFNTEQASPLFKHSRTKQSESQSNAMNRSLVDDVSYDETTSQQFEHRGPPETRELRDSERVRNWDEPHYPTTQRRKSGVIDPVQQLRDNIRPDVEVLTGRSQPDIETVQDLGISEMVSDLSVHSIGGQQQIRNGNNNKTFDQMGSTLTYATERIQQALLQAKKQIYPGETEDDRQSPGISGTEIDIKIDVDVPPADNKNNVPFISRQKEPGDRGLKRNSSLRQAKVKPAKVITHEEPLQKDETQLPEITIVRRRSQSPDMIKSYRASTSRGPELKEKRPKARPRSRTPDGQRWSQIVRDEIQPTVSTSEVRSRSSLRDRLLMDPISVASRESDRVSSRPRSLTPSRSKSRKANSPSAITQMHVEKGRSVTPNRLFGFGRRRKSERFSADSFDRSDRSEERLKLMQQKREIEEKLAAMSLGSVGDASEESLQHSSSPRNLPSRGRATTPKKTKASKLFGVLSSSKSDKRHDIIKTNSSMGNSALEMLRGETSRSRGRGSKGVGPAGLSRRPEPEEAQGHRQPAAKRHSRKSPRQPVSKRWFGKRRDEVPSRASFEVLNSSTGDGHKSSRGSHRNRKIEKDQGPHSVASRSEDYSELSARMVKHMTTFDSLMRAIEKDKKTAPKAEFAVVEVGDEQNTIQASSVLVNKGAVEKQLNKDAKDRKAREESKRRKAKLKSPSTKSAETHDDSGLDQLEMTPSFSRQLKTFEKLSKPPHRIPRGAYML